MATVLTVAESEVVNVPLRQRWIVPPVGDEGQELNAIFVYLMDKED